MRKPPGLPVRTTLCVLLVLTIAGWNFVRLLTSITWSRVLQSYIPQPSALYIGITGAVWAAAGLAVTWGLLNRTRWAPRALIIGAWLYTAWAWSDRIVLQGGRSPNWRFALLGTVILLGFVTAVALDRRTITIFGKEAHEREHQDPSSS